MKKLLTLASIIILFLSTSAQTLNWAKKIDGYNFNTISSKTNSTGDLIIVGTFKGTVDFDPSAGTLNLTSNGSTNEDVFIAKYTSTGTLSWVKKIGGSQTDLVNALTIDNSNNIIIAGKVKNTVDVDPSNLVNNIGGQGKTTSFIAKYNDLGAFTWIKTFGDNVSFKYLSSDNTGKIIAAGSFTNSADFNPAPSINNNLNAAPLEDVPFVASYSASGVYSWAKALGNGNAYLNGIFVDVAKNIYITGEFIHTVDFNPSSSTFNLTSSGNNPDVFFMKLKADGDFVFAKAILGSGFIRSRGGIVVDKIGNIFVAGIFDNTADFDPSTGVKNITAKGPLESDIFVAQYSSTGTFKWVKKIGETTKEEIAPIQLTANDNILLFGKFRGTVDFNPGNLYYNLTASNNFDFFVSCIKNNGDFSFAYQVGSVSNDEFIENAFLTSTLNNGYYITGSFVGSVDFDPSSGNTSLTTPTGSGNNSRQFIAKYTLPANGIMPDDSENRIFEENISHISNLTTHIYLYPNPANDLLNIEYNGFENTNANNIKIYDITGKEISNYSINNNGTTSQINISELKSGIYFITIQTNEKLTRQKFMKVGSKN